MIRHLKLNFCTYISRFHYNHVTDAKFNNFVVKKEKKRKKKSITLSLPPWCDVHVCGRPADGGGVFLGCALRCAGALRAAVPRCLQVLSRAVVNGCYPVWVPRCICNDFTRKCIGSAGARWDASTALGAASVWSHWKAISFGNIHISYWARGISHTDAAYL